MWAAIKGVLGIFSTIGEALRLWRRRQDVETGQLQQQKADLQETVAAQKRVQQAEAGPRGREVTQDALDSGRF